LGQGQIGFIRQVTS